VVVAITVYFVVIQGYAAWAFAAESRHAAGVTGWRLRLAAIGTGLFAAVVLITNFITFTPSLSQTGAAITRLLSIGMVIGYYFGLATPRSMRRIWQRGELYRFLRETAERDPADRGEHAAEDLSRAASRGVPSTANAVLLGRSPLVVRAASESSWLGRSVVPGTGLIGRAPDSPAVGVPADCEGDFAALAAAAGDHVTTVPIAARGNYWGVLLVVQRRGSLFPEDDVDLLLRLCRHTADTLEHSRLLTSERDRQRREADVRVRDSESRLRLMLESIKDYAMITIDNAGMVTSWNVGARDLFGYATGAILGRPVTEFFGHDSVTLPEDLAEAGRTGRVVREGACRRADGSSFTGSTVIRPLRREGETTGGFVVVTHDVTERRQLEARLRQAEKMEAVGRLAGGVAHDFNNLLLVILGYGAELEAVPMNEAHRAGVVEILKAAEQASTLTRQLLAFSRQQVLQPRIMSLPALLREVLPMLTRLLGEHIEIVQQIEDVPPILADPGQLHQIVINLAVNARDAMVGGGRLTIRTASVTIDPTFTWTHLEARPGAHALLEISDTGTGMDESIRTRIFEPFFTTKEFDRGTGLGLATVYGIVKQMQGGISVRSEIGQGTTFTVYIPLANQILSQ
jgi:PAS domain S-box-containing protein